jgi:hypothetical protein
MPGWRGPGVKERGSVAGFIPAKQEATIRAALANGTGILKVAKQLKVGTGTVHRIARENRAVQTN